MRSGARGLALPRLTMCPWDQVECCLEAQDPHGSLSRLKHGAQQVWPAIFQQLMKSPKVSSARILQELIVVGKKAKLRAAQAEAEHNEAILQGLNAFTQLDTTNRWDVSVALCCNADRTGRGR